MSRRGGYFGTDRIMALTDGVVAIVMVLAAFLYSLTAIACFFLETESSASKVAGTVGFVILLFVARYFFRENEGLRLGSHVFIGVALVTLLLIPNAYWRIPLVTFTRLVYEDNLAGTAYANVLRTPYG